LIVSCAAALPTIATAIARGVINRATHVFHIAASAAEGEFG
jgi:hypothetical protein